MRNKIAGLISSGQETQIDVIRETALARKNVPVVKETLCSLPPLNAVAARVMKMSGDSEADTKSVASIIEADPAFASDVLYIANSPLFGSASQVNGVRQAIMILGMDRIKSLALTTAMRAFVGKSRVPYLRESWRHSAGTAIIAEMLAPYFDLTSDRSYTAGLMHDVGRLGLLKAFPGAYAEVLAHDSHEMVTHIMGAEQLALGMDHCTAGAFLARAWGFPGIFEEVCACHHDSCRSQKSDLLFVVQVACRLSDSLGFPVVRYRSIPGYESILEELPTWVRSRMSWSSDDMRRHVEKKLSELKMEF